MFFFVSKPCPSFIKHYQCRIFMTPNIEKVINLCLFSFTVQFLAKTFESRKRIKAIFQAIKIKVSDFLTIFTFGKLLRINPAGL